MVNIGESQGTAVKPNKPKMLTGLIQNGRVAGVTGPVSVTADSRATGSVVRPEPLGYTHGTKEPRTVPAQAGKLVARRAGNGVGIGCPKKRKPVCNGSDRGAASPRKRADIGWVLNHERAEANV